MSGPQPARGVSRRRLVVILIGIVISIVATWLVIRGVDLEAVAVIVAAASPGWLLAALGVIAMQTVVRAARWRLLLPDRPAAAGVAHRKPSIARIVPVLLVGYLGNAVLPGRLGDAARGVLIARREDLPVPQSLGSVLIERVIDTLVLATLGTTAALIVGVPDWIVRIGMIGAGISVVAIVALTLAPRMLRRFTRGPLGRLVRFASGVATGANVADRPAAFGGAVLLSLVAWILDASIYWLVGRSLGIELSPVAAALISTVTVLSTAVPSAPGYVGTFELAAIAAAGVVGIDATTALAFAVVVHAVVVLPIALAGAVALVALGADARMSFGSAQSSEQQTALL